MVTQFIKDINFINLEFSVPTENEQSPKVMEEFFNSLHSVQTNPNFLDRFSRFSNLGINFLRTSTESLNCVV